MKRKALEDMTIEEMWDEVDRLWDEGRIGHANVIKRAILLRFQGKY